MNDDVDISGWSLPGAAEAPRDDLRVQVEVYDETILLRGFEDNAAWVRTVSADGIADVLTQHLGFSSGLLPEDTLWWSQGETGQVVGLWRPPQVWSVALQREAFKPPARGSAAWPGSGRLPTLPPASGFPCRACSSSARRAARPGSTPQRAGRRTPSSSSSGPRPSTSSTTEGSAPEATGSRRKWD